MARWPEYNEVGMESCVFGHNFMAMYTSIIIIIIIIIILYY
jgi:hypothetical protein